LSSDTHTIGTTTIRRSRKAGEGTGRDNQI
jgi:hypothetical protein